MTNSERERSSSQEREATLWLTGLPCAGKSTIAFDLAVALRKLGRRVEVLDGDVVREGLSKGLGYSREDRLVNVLRIALVADLLTRNGVTVVVAAVSPHAAAREHVRRRLPGYFEVHVDCPVEECERRDVKGMYRGARAGVIAFFTGVNDVYEPPAHPDVTVRTDREEVWQSVSIILEALHHFERSQRSVSASGES